MVMMDFHFKLIYLSLSVEILLHLLFNFFFFFSVYWFHTDVCYISVVTVRPESADGSNGQGDIFLDIYAV